jgi:hypothetical protein
MTYMEVELDKTDNEFVWMQVRKINWGKEGEKRRERERGERGGNLFNCLHRIYSHQPFTAHTRQILASLLSLLKL